MLQGASSVCPSPYHIMSSRRRARQYKKLKNRNADPKKPCDDENSTGKIFIHGEKVLCRPGWSLEASLKDIGVQEVEASTISRLID